MMSCDIQHTIEGEITGLFMFAHCYQCCKPQDKYIGAIFFESCDLLSKLGFKKGKRVCMNCLEQTMRWSQWIVSLPPLLSAVSTVKYSYVELVRSKYVKNARK